MIPTDRDDLRNYLLEVLDRAREAHDQRDFQALHRIEEELDIKQMEGWPLALAEVARHAVLAIANSRLTSAEAALHGFLDGVPKARNYLIRLASFELLDMEEVPEFSSAHLYIGMPEIRLWETLYNEGIITRTHAGWALNRYFRETVRWILMKRPT